MIEDITAKDLKRGFAFIKKGRGNRAVYVVTTAHKDGTISYGRDQMIKGFDGTTIRTPADEFLKNVFGRKAESLSEKYARARVEANVTAERIERTKDSQFTAVLMNFLIDAKAGKDISVLTKGLEEFVKSEREDAHEEGHDEGYESRREEYSSGRYSF